MLALSMAVSTGLAPVFFPFFYLSTLVTVAMVKYQTEATVCGMCWLRLPKGHTRPRSMQWLVPLLPHQEAEASYFFKCLTFDNFVTYAR